MSLLRRLAPTLKAGTPAGTAHQNSSARHWRRVRLPIDFSQHTRLCIGLYELDLHRYSRALWIPGIRSSYWLTKPDGSVLSMGRTAR